MKLTDIDINGATVTYRQAMALPVSALRDPSDKVELVMRMIDAGAPAFPFAVLKAPDGAAARTALWINEDVVALVMAATAAIHLGWVLSHEILMPVDGARQ